MAEPAPVEDLVRLIGASTQTLADTLAAAVSRAAAATLEPTGTHYRFD